MRERGGGRDTLKLVRGATLYVKNEQTSGLEDPLFRFGQDSSSHS